MAKGRAATPGAPQAKSDRLSFSEERELETLPDRMASLEAEQKTLVARLEDPSLYGREPMEARRVAIRLEEIEAELLALLERWESRALTR
jgi:ATP-binding cassette subfamily F protein uup